MMEPFLYFILFVICLLVLLATGLPVAVAMGVLGIFGTFIFVGPNALTQLGVIAFNQSSSMALLVVPLFVFMGETLAISAIGTNLFRTAQLWLGRLPGALGIGTILASTGFSAVTGSSPVTAATIGSIAVPEMVKNGYDRKLALGATAAGGTLGILIPPSIPMILYGIITETSIGALFMAGILPGLMIALLLSITVVIKTALSSNRAEAAVVNILWKDRIRSLISVIPVLVLGIVVLGSIYMGVATPTESGALGAAGAFLLILLTGYFAFNTFKKVLENTVKTTAMFLLLLIGGLFSSFFLNLLGIPQGMANFITSLNVSPWAIIICINILLLILGMFIDPMSILVIIIPLFFPTVMNLGFDPVWFGIMVTINIEIAAITPPVGFNLFILKSVVEDVTLSEVIRSSLIFIIPLVVGLILIILFPDIALFLPSIMR